MDGGRIAAMFAANAELDVGSRLSTALDRNFHQFADTGLIQGDEGIVPHQAAGAINVDEGRGVVPRQPIGRLGQVVGAEAKKLGIFGDPSANRAARGSSIIVPTR